jgi:hypothetical protein
MKAPFSRFVGEIWKIFWVLVRSGRFSRFASKFVGENDDFLIHYY